MADREIKKVQADQRFSMGLFDSDMDYLTAIPGMVESIRAAAAEPLEDCVDVSEIWADV